jgi:hypothetical protein
MLLFIKSNAMSRMSVNVDIALGSVMLIILTSMAEIGSSESRAFLFAIAKSLLPLKGLN